MSAIWKYAFPVGGGTFRPLMPEGAEIVHVAMQADGLSETLCAWALVDPAAALKPVALAVFATGQEFDADEWEHVGTGIFLGGRYVWHLCRRRGA